MADRMFLMPELEIERVLRNVTMISQIFDIRLQLRKTFSANIGLLAVL